jgi:hypothetical protein
MHRFLCAGQIRTTVAIVKRRVAAGEDPETVWRESHPGRCPGLGRGENAYLFIEDGLSDSEVPVVICRPGSHLARSFSVCGWSVAYRENPAIHVGYANGESKELYDADRETLLADLTARSVVARDRSGAAVTVRTTDPTARTWAVYLYPGNSLYQPLLVVILAALVFYFAGRRAETAGKHGPTRTNTDGGPASSAPSTGSRRL